MIPAREYFAANLADYLCDAMLILILFVMGCSATTILIWWSVMVLLGIRVTCRNYLKHSTPSEGEGGLV